jgi:hypothetical protein
VHRHVLTFIAIYHPDTHTTHVTAVCKEVSGKDEMVDTDVFFSRTAELVWENGQDVSVRAAANKAVEKFVQHARLDHMY